MTYVLTWLGLMALLALTFGSAYLPMGAWNSAANMAISCAKAFAYRSVLHASAAGWRAAAPRRLHRIALARASLRPELDGLLDAAPLARALVATLTLTFSSARS